MFTFCIQRVSSSPPPISSAELMKELEDTIRVEARDFGKPIHQALREEINRRYANRVRPFLPSHTLITNEGWE